MAYISTTQRCNVPLSAIMIVESQVEFWSHLIVVAPFYWELLDLDLKGFFIFFPDCFLFR
jgi:hypothetical protein